MITTALDGVAVFGFISGFFTLVLFAYRQHLKTRLPVIAVGMACCGTYGFLAGVWPVGFVLVAVSASEFERWWHGRRRIQTASMATGAVVHAQQRPSESRIVRMFGEA